MKRYLLRYVIFWLPALLVSYLFRNASVLSHILQWFFAFFMVLGWAVNTGMAAYRFPRNTLSFLLIYSGLSILSLVILTSSPYGSLRHTLSSHIGGSISFRPLDIICQALRDFGTSQEYYALGFLLCCCAAGYITGMIYRRIRPNPYRPQIVRSRR